MQFLNMDLIEKDMLNNTIKIAQLKLQKHQELGAKSELNIFEVAKLMDSIRHAERVKQSVHVNSIFHAISAN